MAKTTKRIHSVTIKRVFDDSPDTSWLGEYANKPDSEFSIDRAHDLACLSQEYNHPTSDGSDHLQNAIEYLESEYDAITDIGHQRDCPRMMVNSAECLCIIDRLQTSNTDARQMLEELRDYQCTCGGEYRNHNEYRFFNPSSNYKGESPENTIKYVRQDYERMESLNAGHWCFIGIRAEAQYSIAENKAGGSLLQDLTSGGLYGIESDSEKSYLKSVEDEELSELRSQLHAIGFSQRAINAAFKDVEHKSE